jgi:hypothetical protein
MSLPPLTPKTGWIFFPTRGSKYWIAMWPINKLPPWFQSFIGLTGFLLSASAGRLPEALQDIGLIVGIIMLIIAFPGVLYSFFKTTLPSTKVSLASALTMILTSIMVVAILFWMLIPAKTVTATPGATPPKSKALVSNQELISQEQRNNSNWLILYTGKLTSGGRKLQVFVEYQGEIYDTIQPARILPIRDIENYYSGQEIHITVAQAYNYTGPPGSSHRAVRWGSGPIDQTANYHFDTKILYKARLIFINDVGDRHYYYFIVLKKLPPCRGRPSCPDTDLDEELTLLKQNELDYTSWFPEP